MQDLTERHRDRPKTLAFKGPSGAHRSRAARKLSGWRNSYYAYRSSVSDEADPPRRNGFGWLECFQAVRQRS